VADRIADLATQVVFVLIAVLTLAEFARDRRPMKRDSALMFLSLGGIIALQWITNTLGVTGRWLVLLAAGGIVAHPYFLLRMVRHVRPVPGTVMIAALAGMVLSWVGLVAFGDPAPPAATLFAIVYFALTEGYAGLALVLGALVERGTARRQLTYAAAGSGLLVALILLSALNVVVPGMALLTQPVARLLAILSGVSYYLGFAPPGWIRDSWRALRLSGQVALAVGSATAVIALSTTAAVAWQVSQTWSNQVAASQQGLAQLAAEAVGQHLDSVRVDVTQATAGPTLRAGVTQEPWDITLVRPALERLREGSPVIGGVAILDANGVLRAAAGGGTSGSAGGSGAAGSASGAGGLQLADREYFQGAMSTQQAYISNPFTSGSGTPPILAVAAPVRGADGQIRGVLVATLDLGHLTSAIQLPGTATGTNVIAVSPSGVIAVHPNPARLLQPASDESEHAGDALAGQQGAAIEPATSNLPERLVAYAPVPTTRWAVLVSTPTGALFSPIWTATLRAGALTLALIAVLAVASALLVNRMFQPLRALTVAAASFGAGDYAVRVKPGGPPDVAALGAQFNAMARAVAEQSAELSLQNHQLEEATRLKSEFLANMSHELRTPLNAIIGFSELMLDGGEDDPETRALYLGTIHSSGTHLLALINDILDLSKVEAGKMELHPEPFDVEELIGQTLATVEPLAQRKEIVLNASAAGAGQIIADPGRVKQVLLNLLSNAIKFTPEGGRVGVEASRVPDGVQLTVIDTGIGIAPEDQERVFAEFQQVDGSASRQHEGTGLGLALTRRFVEMHGGRIWLESVLGEGSKFHVLLPVGAPNGRSIAVPGAQSAPPRAGDPSAPLVLIVDDDPRAAALLSLYLGRGGYRSEIASNGVEATVKAVDLRPFAITLDIDLPRIDGWEVLRTLKQDERVRDIPVVIVSIVDDEQLGYALGAVDYFVKPVDRQALLARLDRFNFTRQVRVRELTVLVVDDDPLAVELLSGMLTPEGYRVVRASGGGEGIALARSERPDLILLDLMMPEITGFDVVDALKSDPTTEGIPILVVTAKEVTAAEKQQLQHVMAVLQKGGLARVDLLAWLSEVADRIEARAVEEAGVGRT
jgi:signal transduction histidine kinase/CheY-like chemotaxis protein